ncbi:MAG: GFA family protein [Myxococcota bacterium]|nr:GFA family protein [Myxococcota bacterium]
MVRGSCLCGGVAFEIEGELTPIQLCHARRCRKATGAAAAPEMLAPAEGVRFTRGQELVREYEAPLLSEPPAYRRAFCGTCGSPLPVALTGTPFFILIAGVLDDDPGTREFRHGFVDEKAAWHTITGELPQYEGRPPRP